MSAKGFVKTVKGVRRGVGIAKILRNKLVPALLVFLGLIGGSALFVWWQERGFRGSYFDSLWSVLFLKSM